ncbi:MAG: helix-turn-helix transcriptional regulator [Betaproteobacteria bacterium]|nr:helix-turn-helix transcriptional regulator [Betaproteobacteria bacterium]
MKKHPTKAVSVTFSGPLSGMEKALEAMEALGFRKVEEDAVHSTDSVAWRESEHFSNLLFPGSYIAGFRHREGITQVALSEKTGIPRRHISEMENGKRTIGKTNAKKLAKVLNIDSRMLLSV